MAIDMVHTIIVITITREVIVTVTDTLTDLVMVIMGLLDFMVTMIVTTIMDTVDKLLFVDYGTQRLVEFS